MTKRFGLMLIALLALVGSAFADATIVSGPAVRQYPGRLFGAAVVLTNGSPATAVITLPSATLAGVATVYGAYTVFSFLSAGDFVVPGDSVTVDVTDGFNFDSKTIVCAVGAGGLTSCR